MGSVRVRADTGRLFFEFRYQGHRCREQTALPDSPANRRKMEKILNRIEAEIALGQFDYLAYFPNSSKGRALMRAEASDARRIDHSAEPQVAGTKFPLFSEFSTLWLDENRIRWRISTFEMQEGIVRKHLVPRLNSRTVDCISKADVLAIRTELAKAPGQGGKFLSPKTINEIIGTLKAILDEAADRYGFKSPTKRIQRLKVQKQDIQPFRLEEVSLILESVRPDYRNYMVLRFFTGMRSGEIHGLKWKHVDFERRQILIRETFTKGRTEYTKNDGSQREVYMCDQVLEALNRQIKATQHLSDYVFCNRMGLPLDNKNFTERVWYPLLRYLNLSRRRPYQTRHTAATLWLAAGEAPEWIARQMGHSSTEMLFRVYSRYVPNLTRQDGSAFDRLIASRLDLSAKPSRDTDFSPPHPPRRGESS